MSAKSRRQYGTGSISQRPDGRWMGRIDAGTTNQGKRRRITVYGTTEAEAKAKLERKRKQIAREGVGIATTTRASVKSWATRWLETRVTTQRPLAYAADASAVKNWIVPTIGTRRLENLTPADIRAVTQAQRDKGLASSSALRTHRTMMKMLKDAMLEGHDVPQRVLLVPGPTVGSNDREPFPIEDAIAILGQAAALPHGSRWATAFLQGMRPSECLGLTWACVDFDRGLITVSWQLQTLRYNKPYDRTSGFRVPDGYETVHLIDAFHLVRPKSRSGWRVIPMVPWIRDALLRWQTIAPANPYDLVWPTLDGHPATAGDDDDEWKAMQGAVGLDRWVTAEETGQQPRGLHHPSGRYYVRHEARHTTATLLLEAGVDTQVITTILGHSSIVTSRGYMHARTELATDALEQIAKQLQLAPPPALTSGVAQLGRVEALDQH